MDISRKNTISVSSLVGSSLFLLGATTPAHAAVVINEIDYDQPGGDAAEFIELYNSDSNPLLLDGFILDLVNGSNGNSYRSFDLSGMTIDANGYFVVCGDNTAVANCDLDIAAGSWIQNGGSDGDAIALLRGATLLDSVAYEGIGTMLGTWAEGGSFATADSNSIGMSIARVPDGSDTNINAGDFSSACLTPGSANISGTGDCSTSLNPVPLPAAAWLFGSGLIGLIGIARRKATS